MELHNGICITKTKKGEWHSNILGWWKKFDELEDISLISYLYKVFRKKKLAFSAKLNWLNNTKTDLENNIINRQAAASNNVNIAIDNAVDECDTFNDVVEETIKETADVKLNRGLIKLIDFFTEFQFEPNFRFVNNISRMLAFDKHSVFNYISNYFKLTNNNYTNSIVEKMKSVEFDSILDDLSASITTKQINNRFKLYYGSQGTGKTTKAMEEANNNVVVCHSAMLPSDLMEDFKFVDGKAEFTPSALCNAMTTGNVIVLDEINLLPFESLRFLQSILDNKAQFEYKGKTINIADGFKIIGTMNLQVNGMTYALPEPLVDRAEDLKCFVLTADKLIGAIL